MYMCMYICMYVDHVYHWAGDTGEPEET
jgi:hypothetical protein